MTTITIPQLPTIPNTNISVSSILPIVDTTGAPQTDKVTVGNLANFMLSQAGNLLENVFLSTYAQSVTNAAQPNITSVGTLTSLTVNGNISLGNLTFNNSNISSNISNSGINIVSNGTGNININSNNNIWKFDSTGNLTTPGDIIGPANANFIIYANAAVHSFTFAKDGTFYAPDNVVLGGDSISIGPGANTLGANLSHAVLVASSNGQAYIQAVINNVSDNGSADWVALGHRGNDDNGWTDMGFNSAGFNDANYTLTSRGDGYLIVQTFDGNTVPGGPAGGNLILATGDAGNTRDIIFATGGFSTENEFARISNANGAFEFFSNLSANITGANAIIANSFFGNLTGGSLTFSYSNIYVDINGNPIIDGTNARQIRINHNPYMQIFAPNVEISDYGTIPGPSLAIIGYTDSTNQPLSAYLSVQDQANATQQWDFGIIGQGDNNFTVRDRTSSNQWTFGTDGNLTLPSDSSSINYYNGNPYGIPVGNNGAVQVNWLGSFSDQGGTPSDTYSTLQFDSNGMPTLNGTAAYQQRVDYSPYLQVLAPRVESTDFDIIAGPGLTVVGYDDNYNTPRSAYLSVQDQANATQQWDFGILGEGDNNFTLRDRTSSNVWTFGTDGNLTLPANTFAINYANGNQVILGGNYGNSNVATFLASYGSNTISTTGNVKTGLLIAPASDSGSIIFSTNGADNNGSLKVDTGLNMTINANSNFYVKQNGSDRLAITNANTDLMAASNVVIHANKAGTEKNWIFSSDGNLSTPGELIIYGGTTIDFHQQVGNITWGTSYMAFSQYGRVELNTNLYANANIIGANVLNSNSIAVSGNANVSGNLILSNTTQIVSTPGSNGNITLDPDGTGVVNVIGNVVANNFSGNISITGNINGTSPNVTLVAGSYNYVFDNTGNFTLPANSDIIMSGESSTVLVGGTVNAALHTSYTSSWTLATGTNTVNINVPLSGTYSIWINGNIPNGIVTYTATAVVTNTNVPVLGAQYGWYYVTGNALVLTSIPNQFVGTQGAISNASAYLGNTANVFTFGITNNSGANAVVNYGYTRLG